MGLDLKYTESEQILRKSALDFLKRDAPKEVVQVLQETDTGVTDVLWQKVVDMGWLGIIIPEEYGGVGSTLTSAGVLFEALGTGPLPGPYFSSGILGASIILEAASEEQKQRILPEVAEGRIILALALTEESYRWEPDAIQMSAEEKDGEFTLNGRKLFVMDAEAATHLIVVARTEKVDDRSKGITVFLVDKQTPRVSVRRLPGFLSDRNFEVKLDSVKVPESAVLGKVGGGWNPLKQGIDKSIPVLCAYKAGACKALFDATMDYARTRIQFSQPIGRFQRVQDLIIEMIDHMDAAKWSTYECLWKLDNDRPAQQSIHLAKAISSEAYWQVTNQAIKVFSGISYSREHYVSFHVKASRSLYNFLGEPTYHRQKLAELVLA
ncbi:MAG TPA: acyl-CoA dehydrogenase family protein [Dehalococcoidia bacterium]|nr:acyl-CoA dehydrogenase family protein [Dehalococcoidia bacterium]